MIPEELSAYFHDSSLELIGWDPETRCLSLRIKKEIGPETGLIIFHQTSFIGLPVSFPGESISSCPVKKLDAEFWANYPAGPTEFDSDDIAFLIADQEDGKTNLVIAKRVEYRITQP